MTDDRQMDDKIREMLQTSHASAPFPAEAIAARIDTTVRARGGAPRRNMWSWSRGVMAAAAVLLVFAAGAVYGRATISSPEPGLGTTPISIQTAGSEYVAQLAQFSASAGDLTPAERNQARQVALAIQYAAIQELLNESSDDELLRAAAQLIFSRRQAARNPSHEGALWF